MEHRAKPHTNGRRLPRPLLLYWAATTVACFLMVAVGYARLRAGAPRPYWNPLSDPLFSDLLEYLPTYRLLHTAAFFHNAATHPVAYPPFSAVVYAALYATGHPVAVYLGTAVLWLAAVVTGVGRWLVSQGIGRRVSWLFPLSVVLLAFPFEGLIQTGNIELFLWIFAATGTWAFLRGHDETAAVLWAAAGAMKLYPLIFLVLLLPRRKYRALACGAGTLVGLTLLSLLYLGPTVAIAWHGSLHNVFGYQGVRVTEWSLHELAANHSAFNWVKLGVVLFHGGFASATLPYFAVGSACFVAVFVWRLRSMPAINQLLAVTIFILLFPPISYFYTLVHLFAPIVAMAGITITAEREGQSVHRLQTCLLLMAPVLASFLLLTVPRYLLFGGLLQASLLLGIFAFAVTSPFAVARQVDSERQSRGCVALPRSSMSRFDDESCNDISPLLQQG